LQFDVVIIPFLNDSLNPMDKKVWYPLENMINVNIKYCMMNFSQKLKEYGSIENEIWKNFITQNELENINLLYVAFTRAIKKLYLIIENEKNEKKNYAFLIKNFLKNLQNIKKISLLK